MQDIVVGNKTFTDVTRPSEIVQLLLNEDQLANLEATNGISEKAQGKQPARMTDVNVGDLWAEEGDEFFGQSNAGTSADQMKDDDDAPNPPPTARGRGRGRGRSRGRGGGGGDVGEATRGRKPRGRGRGAARKDVAPSS